MQDIFIKNILVLRAAVLRTAGFKNRPLLLSSIACNAEGRNLFPAASAAARTNVKKGSSTHSSTDGCTVKRKA
jgi:hypothetical protein